LFWAFIGGCLGGIANYLRQKNQLLILPFAISIIIAIGLAGYLYNDIQTENAYERSIGNTMTDLAFNELLEIEADSYLNKTPNNSSNLKEAQIRYQRMILLTQDAQMWNNKILKSNPIPIRMEYSQVMADYLDLKLKYYTEMKNGIELYLKNDKRGAQIHYQNAKKLLPQIKKQEKLLETIQNKDPEFKNYIAIQINQSRNFAQMEKQRNELLTFPTLPAKVDEI